MTFSSSTLRVLPLKLGNQSVDALRFGPQRSLDARRRPFLVGDFGDVLTANSQLASYPAVHSCRELLSINEGIHISCERDKSAGDNVPSEDEDYPHWDKLVKKKIQKILLTGVSSPIGGRLFALRKSRGLNQTQFGQLLGVGQSRIAKWEKGELSIPPKALLAISELAREGEERQSWRDEAARLAGFGERAEASDAISLFKAHLFLTIPLVRNPLRVGDLGQMDVAEVKENLQLPQHWFAEGGTIRAFVIKNNPLSSLIAGDYIAIVDISRRDPDRLIDCVVATRTVTGIEGRLLRKDRNVYFLQPLREGSGHSVRILKHDGEDSIVGQVLKWIADAPNPSKPH